MINQKTYVANYKVAYWLFIIFSIFLIFSFIWNLKYIFYIVYIWVLFGIVILSHYLQKRVFKIVLDKSNGKIIVYETKFFNYKQFRHEMPISEIDCFIYKVHGGGTSVYFKIEFKKKLIFDFSAASYGWSLIDLRDLLKNIEEYKSSVL